MKTKEMTIQHRESGLALISLIIVMLILGVVAYTFVSIISTHRYGFGVTESSVKAFYIKEGAFQLGQKYCSDRNPVADYDPQVNFRLFTDEPMGDGTFSVWVSQTDDPSGIRWTTFSTTANVSY